MICVVLGRGADDEKVDHWLRQGAPVDGYVGFAIGRTIWWDALKGFLDGNIEREAAAQQIADNYLRFVRVYEEAGPQRAGRPRSAVACRSRCGCGSHSPSSRRPSVEEAADSVVRRERLRREAAQRSQVRARGAHAQGGHGALRAAHALDHRDRRGGHDRDVPDARRCWLG